MSLKIIFAGTPAFSVPPLKALVESKHQVIAVLTQPDRPAGRGQKIKSSEIKNYALAQQLPVLQPKTLKSDEIQSQLQAYQADIMVVVAYGLILPVAVLSLPKLGCFNIHASLLPKWRGAAPIHRAILNGDQETGISIIQMDKGLDTGDVLHTCVTPIHPNETTGQLHDRLSELGSQALMETLNKLQKNSLTAEKQNHQISTYADKIQKSEANINWQQSSQEILNHIRAFHPWPIAQSHLKGKVYRLWHAENLNTKSHYEAGTVISLSQLGLDIATHDGSIRITQLQLAGRKKTDIADFANGQTGITPEVDRFTDQ